MTTRKSFRSVEMGDSNMSEGSTSDSMNAEAARQLKLTPEEYLAVERLAETKSEYIDGEVLAMSGASLEHKQIAVSLAHLLTAAFRKGPCQVFVSEMRTRIPATNAYVYPDLVGTCVKPILEDDHFDTLMNPQFLIEVLSPSTEAYDRGRKFTMYRRIESLQEILLVSQDRPQIEQYTKADDGTWRLIGLSGDDVAELQTGGVKLSLADVYERVEFETE